MQTIITPILFFTAGALLVVIEVVGVVGVVVVVVVVAVQ